MKEPVWVLESVVIALHEEQLKEHGGAAGIRDPGALQSALHRPKNLFDYGSPDLADLAGSYAFGLARNHPFTDGNKRISNVVSETFVLLNGRDVEATDEERVRTWLALASGEIGEDAITDWFVAHLV